MSSQWGLAVCWQWDRGAGTGTRTKDNVQKQPGDASGSNAPRPGPTGRPSGRAPCSRACAPPSLPAAAIDLPAQSTEPVEGRLGFNFLLEIEQFGSEPRPRPGPTAESGRQWGLPLPEILYRCGPSGKRAYLGGGGGRRWGGGRLRCTPLRSSQAAAPRDRAELGADRRDGTEAGTGQNGMEAGTGQNGTCPLEPAPAPAAFRARAPRVAQPAAHEGPMGNPRNP